MIAKALNDDNSPDNSVRLDLTKEVSQSQFTIQICSSNESFQSIIKINMYTGKTVN